MCRAPSLDSLEAFWVLDLEPRPMRSLYPKCTPRFGDGAFFAFLATLRINKLGERGGLLHC
jgi:hypothetical protein